MKRHPSNKKVTERQKKAKGQKDREVDAKRRDQEPQSGAPDVCRCCSKALLPQERALFVEEEVGRVFCSEACIANFFNPEIKKLEKEYFRRLSPNDLSGEERETLAHLRWMTLQEPDEVWREKTLAGDYRFTLISEFQPDHRRIWCVCICLFLRGEPSFLYLAFPTRNSAMVNYYRKGERVELQKAPVDLESSPSEPPMGFVDGLADAWTEDETLRAQLTRERSADDIPVEEFSLYQSCLEEALEAPDEVWSIEMKEYHSLKLYHFLKYYPDEAPGVWYVVIARETEDEEQIEILDAFPTRDSHLVDQFRRGQQDVGTSDKAYATRMVH